MTRDTNGASATDMARWMIVQLDSGKVAGGERLFSPRTTTELWDIVTPIRPGRYPADLKAWQPQMPEARMATTTSSAPGTGSGKSRTSTWLSPRNTTKNSASGKARFIAGPANTMATRFQSA